VLLLYFEVKITSVSRTALWWFELCCAMECTR